MRNSSHHIAVSIWNTERLLVCQSCRNPPVTLTRAADVSLCRRLRFPPSVRGVFGRMSRLPFKFWSQQKLGFLPVSFLLLSLGFSQTAARKKKNTNSLVLWLRLLGFSVSKQHLSKKNTEHGRSCDVFPPLFAFQILMNEKYNK